MATLRRGFWNEEALDLGHQVITFIDRIPRYNLGVILKKSILSKVSMILNYLYS